VKTEDAPVLKGWTNDLLQYFVSTVVGWVAEKNSRSKARAAEYSNLKVQHELLSGLGVVREHTLVVGENCGAAKFSLKSGKIEDLP